MKEGGGGQRGEGKREGREEELGSKRTYTMK